MTRDVPTYVAGRFLGKGEEIDQASEEFRAKRRKIAKRYKEARG